MKKILVVFYFILLGLFTQAQTGEKNFIDQPYIEVSGTAEQEIVPDMIFLKIVINETDTKGKISLESLEKKMKQRLSDIGIDVAKDLTVGDLSSSYVKYFLKEKDVASSRQYILLVHDAVMAGKAVKTLSNENISNISLVSVDHSQMAQKRFDVRLEAVKTAKLKAEAMAGAIGQNIGKAIFITENSSLNPFVQTNSNVLYYDNVSEMNKNEAELSFKNIIIKSSISAKFILR